jgi:hypothetical protein
MGLYWTTYLCTGTFTDKNNVVIIKKIKIAYIDPIIEDKEWTKGYVEKSELVRVLTNIELVDSDTEDLFLEELCGTSCDVDSETSSKYILVERKCSYTN